MRYEDLLAELFKSGGASLTRLTMAHIAGFADRLPEWLKAAQQKKPHLDARAFQQLFAAVLTGDAATIEATLRDADVRKLVRYQWGRLIADDPSSSEWLDQALGIVIDPLTLIGRGDVIPVLHANSLRRLGAGAKSDLTDIAAHALGPADEWHLALQVLDDARRTSADIRLNDEGLLWKYAYLHGRVDSVMPVLAQMPFSADLKHLVEQRAWKLKAYQIRAGMSGIKVPVIEGEQPNGYDEAVAMQIAALADDPSATNVVRELRRVLQPRSVEIIHADRGIAFSTANLPRVLVEAEAKIAARRKDYAKAAAVARTTSQDILFDPPTVVIDALLDEGDWRAAVDILRNHDPRKKKVIAGFDDDRAGQAVILYNQLAFAAAWRGDDVAAAALLAQAKEIDRVEIRRGDGRRTDKAFVWLDTLLAGLAEGRLPRKHLYVLTHAFRSAY